MSDEKARLRAIDVRVAEEVMGLEVVGEETIVYADGDEMVWPGDPKRWMCGASREPVYLAECVCGGNPEEDALVPSSHGHDRDCLRRVPCYSGSILEAMRVVEKVRERYSNFALYADNGWGAWFWIVGAAGLEKGARASGTASTPAEAICLAALEAIGCLER